MIAEVDNLTKRFGSFTAVDSVSFQVGSGSCFGLLGPNGAGKTTIIKMMTTLLKPDGGRVTVGGFDLSQKPTQVRQCIGYVPQAISVDGTLTGLENLRIMAKLYNVPRHERKDRIDELIALLDLGEAIYRQAKTYSGGMVRRLEIAQTMLHRPPLLFLDEPTVGMDPLARQAVWRHIKGLQETYGMSLVLTTHYMEEAEELCDTIAVIKQGKMAAIGSLEDLRVRAGKPGATMNDLFAHFAGTFEEDGSRGGLKDAARNRRIAHRLG